MNTVLLGMVGIGLSLVVHALTPAEQWWIAAASMGVCGLLLPILNGPVYAILQSVVEVSIQGRVFALQNSINSGASVLALILVGALSDVLNVQKLLLYNGIGVCVMALWAVMSPTMKEIEKNRQG